jgi:hypothetical protein
MSPRKACTLAVCRRVVDLLDVSDEVDAILVVLSLSSDTRMLFKWRN